MPPGAGRNVSCGSLSTEALGSAARPTSASPRKVTSGRYEKLVVISRNGFWLKERASIADASSQVEAPGSAPCARSSPGSSRGGLKSSCRGAAARPLASTLGSDLADQANTTSKTA